MSLLMEALRKAEEAKRQSQETRGEAPRFTLEPLEPASTAKAPDTAAAGSAPSAAAKAADDTIRDYLQADLAAEDRTLLQRDSSTPTSARSGSPGSSGERSRLAAASVFAAKQHAATAPRSRVGLLSVLGLGVACLVGGSTWYLSRLPSSTLVLSPPPDSLALARRGFVDAPSATDAATLQDSNPATVAASRAPAAAPATTAAAEDTIAADTAAASALATAAPAASQPRRELLPPRQPVAAPEPAATPAAAVPAATERTLQISRSVNRSSTDSRLQAAWSALQATDLQQAQLLYQAVLEDQPGNRDAMIGLAAIHLRNGELAAATSLYSRVLTLDPQDPYAQAGLLQSTRGGSDPAYEAELQSLLQRHPGMAQLHFALGNHYAGQQRWSEAQAAYFEALLQARRDSSLPPSPDYAFNLAVSLERLQQPRAALNYYRQAEELAQHTAPGFDPALLQLRIHALQETSTP